MKHAKKWNSDMKRNNHEKKYTCESNQKSDLNKTSKEPLQYFQRTIGN